MSEVETPVATTRRRRGRPAELHSADHHTVPVRDTILTLDKAPEADGEIVVAETPLNKDYQAALAFNEEPVTMIIHASSDKNAPRHQECWVNGRGIEFLTSEGKWRVNWPGTAPGYAPVGVEFTTKRKYAEVLLRKRQDNVTTRVEERSGEDPVNHVERANVMMAPLSVTADANPKGREWLMRIMAES